MPSVPVLLCHCQQVRIVLRRFSSPLRQRLENVWTPYPPLTWRGASTYMKTTRAQKKKKNEWWGNAVALWLQHARKRFLQEPKGNTDIPPHSWLTCPQLKLKVNLSSSLGQIMNVYLCCGHQTFSAWVSDSWKRRQGVRLCTAGNASLLYAFLYLFFFSLQEDFYLKHVWQARWASRLWRVRALLRLLHTFAPWWMTGSRKQYSCWHIVYLLIHTFRLKIEKPFPGEMFSRVRGVTLRLKQMRFVCLSNEKSPSTWG